MPDKIVLRRGDGTLLEATPEQASRLRLLGYEPETPEQSNEAAKSAAREEYYTSGAQKLETGLEGAAAGLTFGASDYLFGDDQTKARAHYNPGTRLGAEVVGALAPLVLSGGAAPGVARAAGATELVGAEAGVSGLKALPSGIKALPSGEATIGVKAAQAVEEAGALGKVAKAAPTSLLSDAARALSVGKEGSLAKAVSRGAIEGAVYGGTGAADHAYLDGDPVTAEAVLHGIGWGALAGGALSALGHGVGKLGEHEAKLVAAEKEAAKPIPYGTLEKTAGTEYQALRSEVGSLRGSLKDASKAADAAVNGIIKEFIKTAQDSVLAADTKIFTGNVSRMRSLYNEAMQAAANGKFDAATEAVEAFGEHSANVAKTFGIDPTQVNQAAKALDQLVSIKALHAELRGLPTTAAGFSQLSPQKVERILGAFEKVNDVPFGQIDAIKTAAQNFSKALGVAGEEGAATDLRSTWRAAKTMYQSEGRVSAAAKEVAESDRHPSFLRRAVGYVAGGKAYVAAHAVGAGRVGSYAAYKTVRDAVTYGGRELVGIRAAVVGRLRTAAANYLPATGKAIKAASPAAALSTTLFGDKDDSTSDIRELAANRIKEINGFAPTAKDTLFRAVEPLGVSQPQLAPAMHASALTAFAALHEAVPKDPGVISKLENIWRPSDVHAIVLAKQLEVFHDPVGAAESMLREGQFDPIRVGMLKEVAPSNWQDLRLALLERITDPKVRDKLSYQDQIGLSAMLDLPIHSSMAPQYIATSQQIFMDRNKPLSANPRIGQNGGAPNPADNMTSAQKSETR